MIYLEILFFIGGIYALVTAKVPSFLVGGGFYRIESWLARTIGVLLIIPLPVVYLADLIGGKSTTSVFSLEIATLFVVGVLVLVLTRVVGRQVIPTNDIEAAIAQKTQRALVCAVMSIFVLWMPWAFIYANQALKLIDENRMGEQYRGRASMARVIAVVAVLSAIGGYLYLGYIKSLLIG